MKNKKRIKLLGLLCIITCIIGGVFFVMAVDKKVNYNNPDEEYSIYEDDEDATNVYVGGDAYNYIINGTYFTAYSIIGIGFFIISTIFGVSKILLESYVEKDEEKEIEIEVLPKI